MLLDPTHNLDTKSRAHTSTSLVVCLAGKLLEDAKCHPHVKCAAGKFTKAVGTTSSQPVCDFCRAGYYKASDSAVSTETDVCLAHSTCPRGKFTAIAGTRSRQPVCESCLAGYYKASASATSTVADMCTPHAKCLRGEYTVTAGTGSSQPVCEACRAGYHKASESATSTATDECIAHAACKQGEWTASAGTLTSDTKCLGCSNGRFRVDAPASNAKEVSEVAACAGVHKTCSRGEWTEAVGTRNSDTQCQACSSGRFRASAPTSNKAAEEEAVVCTGPCDDCSA